MVLKKIEVLIGVETHLRIDNNGKIFSFFNYKYSFYQNNYLSFFDLGIPGVLPLFNKKILKKIVLFGLYIGSIIFNISFFVRKNYFYPDIAKNYQISQYKYSILKCGKILIYNNYVNFPYYKFINIKQCHLEEDTGRTIYDFSKKISKLDYNRSNLSLLEIVSYYNLNSFYEVFLYLKNLQNIIRYLGLSNCDMEAGFFRFDINISVRYLNYFNLNKKTEVKNLNSFKALKFVLSYEINRLINLLINSLKFFSETRYYSVSNNNTYFVRFKENNFDYKYFKDPDLYPIFLSFNFINHIYLKLPIFFYVYIWKYNYFTNFFRIILNRRFFLLLIRLNLFVKNFFFLLNLFNENFYFFFKNFSFFKFFNFSFYQLIILLKFYYNNYINLNNFKLIFFLIIKKNIKNIFLLYEIIFLNNLRNIHNKYILNININFFLFSNIKLIHYLFFNKYIFNFIFNDFFKILKFKSSYLFFLFRNKIIF